MAAIYRKFGLIKASLTGKHSHHIEAQVSMFDVSDILSRNLQTVSARPKAKPNKLKSRNGDQSV